jgi:hypothetical protein
MKQYQDMSTLRGFLPHATDCICAMPDHALAILWARFSEIQAATWIEVDKESATRFEQWFSTGDDRDAWS